MEFFLDWYSAHNKLIIQILILVIALIMLYFVYRLFFKSDVDDGLIADNQTDKMHTLDKKVDQLIETLAKDHSVTSSMTSLPPDVELNIVNNLTNELNDTKIKVEIAKEQARSKDLEIENLKKQLAEGGSNYSGPIQSLEHGAMHASDSSEQSVQNSSVSSAVNDDEKKRLESRLEELENKLQEYEIIADDIAELQTLKAENEKLKAQLAEVQSSAEPKV